MSNTMTMRDAWKSLNTQEDVEFLAYLKDRWTDECEYEDINDYLAAIKNRFPAAYKITKRPFGFWMKCTDGRLKVDIKASATQVWLSGKMYAE